MMLELSPDMEQIEKNKAALALLAQEDAEDADPDPQERGAQGGPDTPDTSEGTAADLFTGRLGRIHSGGDGRWSESCGERFVEGMEEKRRQGHL